MFHKDIVCILIQLYFHVCGSFENGWLSSGMMTPCCDSLVPGNPNACPLSVRDTDPCRLIWPDHASCHSICSCEGAMLIDFDTQIFCCNLWLDMGSFLRVSISYGIISARFKHGGIHSHIF